MIGKILAGLYVMFLPWFCVAFFTVLMYGTFDYIGPAAWGEKVRMGWSLITVGLSLALMFTAINEVATNAEKPQENGDGV